MEKKPELSPDEMAAAAKLFEQDDLVQRQLELARLLQAFPDEAAALEYIRNETRLGVPAGQKPTRKRGETPLP